MPLLEIVAYSYASALTAQQGGADRIELCDNTAEGGTTPSLGTIEAVRELPGVKLHVMISPAGATSSTRTPSTRSCSATSP